MREHAEKEVTFPEAATRLDRADRTATSDPRKALPLVQEAFRALKRCEGVGCLETRAFAVLGFTLYKIGRMNQAESAFAVAYRSDCECCRPGTDRRYAYLLNYRGEKSEAIARAVRAVEDSQGHPKGLALITLGTMRYYSGEASIAVRDLREALRLIPVQSRHHSLALANLALFLIDGTVKDVEESVALLRKLPDRFKGLKRLSHERANLAWITGQVLARLAACKKGLEEWSILCESREQLEKTVDTLNRLGLHLDLAAAQTDLAKVQAMLGAVDVVTLEEIPAKGEQDGKAFDFSEVKQAAVDAAYAIFSPDGKMQLWKALRALRDATVKAGAAPPVIVYATP